MIIFQFVCLNEGSYTGMDCTEVPTTVDTKKTDDILGNFS
jgi:hypothetical protein